MIENEVNETLACRQLARVPGGQEELGQAQIVSAFERLVSGERLVTEVEKGLGKGRIVIHAGRRLAHLCQHAVVAGPAIEAVQLKIDTDVRVQVVIPDRKRDGGALQGHQILHAPISLPKSHDFPQSLALAQVSDPSLGPFKFGFYTEMGIQKKHWTTTIGQATGHPALLSQSCFSTPCCG